MKPSCVSQVGTVGCLLKSGVLKEKGRGPQLGAFSLVWAPRSSPEGMCSAVFPPQEPARGPGEPAESGDMGPAAPQNHQQRLEHIVRRAAVEDKVRGGPQLSAVRSEGPLPISGLCNVSPGCFSCSHVATKPLWLLRSLLLGILVPGEVGPAAHPLKAPSIVGTGDVAVPSAQPTYSCIGAPKPHLAAAREVGGEQPEQRQGPAGHRGAALVPCHCPLSWTELQTLALSKTLFNTATPNICLFLLILNVVCVLPRPLALSAGFAFSSCSVASCSCAGGWSRHRRGCADPRLVCFSQPETDFFGRPLLRQRVSTAPGRWQRDGVPTGAAGGPCICSAWTPRARVPSWVFCP